MRKLKNTVFSRFNISLIVQVILIAVIPLVIIWTFFKAHLLLTPIGLTLIWILQIIYLTYYLGRIRRELTRFLFAFIHDDSTMVFNTKTRDSSFNDLHKVFNIILNSFEKIKTEKEKDFIFFQNAIEHVGVGLLSYNDNGNILLANKAFKDLFNIYHLKAIDHLKEIKPELPDLLRSMQNGEQKLIKIVTGNKIVHLSIKSSDFKLSNDSVKIISFQDIKNEIEQSEMEAWQKLIRVLTHEILNSVSPVTLLSKSMINKLECDGKSVNPDDLSVEHINDLLRGLHTINKRSKGLAKFVEDYRNLTQLSTPCITVFSVEVLFNNIITLFAEEIALWGIDLKISVPDELMLTADEKLLEQVIINLVRNSIQAIESTQKPRINLNAFQRKNEKVIQIKDNGAGIAPDMIESIFIPFFTTKENGSGIGLSLSRQIMRLHNGIIAVESKENEGSIFTLVF